MKWTGVPEVATPRVMAQALSTLYCFGGAAGALAVLGAASIVYGSVQALSRRATTEVLAYSSIGQVGYILVAVAVGGEVGYAAAVLFAAINAVNKTLLFLVSDLRGPLVGLAYAVGAFSVAGVPPAVGFFGKVALFQAGIETGSATLVALIFLGGALSFVYMFQIYQHAFWRRDHDGVVSGLSPRLVAVALAAVVVGLGIWPEPLLALSDRAASVLAGTG